MKTSKHTQRLSKEYDLIKSYSKLLKIIDNMEYNTKIAIKLLEFEKKELYL